MRYRGVIWAAIVALTMVMFSCGTLPRKGAPTSEDRDQLVERIASITLNDKPVATQRDTVPPSDYPADAHTLWHYVEGLKAYRLHNDSSGARHHYERALAIDSNYSPAAYHTAAMLMMKSNFKKRR